MVLRQHEAWSELRALRERTAAQQEVWEFEEACWAGQDLEALLPCFHDDYFGWSIGSPVPLSKEDRRPFFARSFETEETVFLHLKPLAVKVHGNVAIVLYLATTTTKNKPRVRRPRSRAVGPTYA
ncbi:MAG: Cif family virulence factor [Planctomycetota bacterium]|jgi:hypothetical protein